MKLYFNPQDAHLVGALVNSMLSKLDDKYKLLLFMGECEPLYLTDFLNTHMEIERLGYTEVVKAIFQGSHPYRSDCGKCPRCYRYRPEITWNNEYLEDKFLCNRCFEVTRNTSCKD